MRLPKRVMPIVDKLRQHVERPEDPPVPYKYGYFGHEDKAFARWLRPGDGGGSSEKACCPMGLLPGADACPGDSTSIPGDYKDGEVEAFADWWDGLTIEEAIKAWRLIWTP